MAQRAIIISRPRPSAQAKTTQQSISEARTKSRKDLLLWMEVLEEYGRDWDETFEHSASYFTQEFWYLLVNCMINAWKGTPLSISRACQQMKTGSNRTREERVRRAVADGYLVKRQSEADRREAIVVPTERLEKIMIGHFSRTLNVAIDTFPKLDET